MKPEDSLPWHTVHKRLTLSLLIILNQVYLLMIMITIGNRRILKEYVS